jgi:hypothetical protein
MRGERVLRDLSRPDKFYLGGGKRLVWAPRFPTHLDRPGFWDGAHYLTMEIEPVFAITLLDERGEAIPLRSAGRDWRPHRLVQRYRSGTALSVVETKALLPEDCLVSELVTRNTSSADRRLHFVLWTAQRSQRSGPKRVTGVGFENGVLGFALYITDRDNVPYRICCALGTDGKVLSYGVCPSEGLIRTPEWSVTPFGERFSRCGTGDDRCALDSANHTERSDIEAADDCLVYLGLHTTARIPAGSHTVVRFSFAAAPARNEAVSACARGAGRRPAAVHGRPESPAQPGSRERPGVTDGGKTGGRPGSGYRMEARGHLEARARHGWAQYFEGLPAFTCSDPYLERYYWYRWYGLRLFTLDVGEDNYPYPCICEGPGSFRLPISYSAPCHLLETRWMRDPSIAQGSILNFVQAQQEDGRYVGHLYPRCLHLESFYHANWGHVWELQRTHPDDEFLERVYRSLGRYVAYFDRERDREGSGLYDILNHYETGQEYMRRYTAVSDRADSEHWGEVFRLKGIDATVYLYEIKRMLGAAAGQLGRPDEAAAWLREAERTKRAVLETMWDHDEEIFCDVDPSSMTRTNVKAAVCFYPYGTDIIDERHLPGLGRHLFNQREFWTPFPVPSTSADDPSFSPHGIWKGKRMNCPWNGRVWPMTNSHMAEAIATAALRFGDTSLRRRAARFIERFIWMMFTGRDPRRPNCYEHYHPFTGHPSLYRGVDDYQHSWVVDLIIKYVCGIRPHDTTVTVDPFPFRLDSFVIDGVPVRGSLIRVEREGRRFTVSVGGREAGRSRLGKALELEL